MTTYFDSEDNYRTGCRNVSLCQDSPIQDYVHPNDQTHRTLTNKNNGSLNEKEVVHVFISIWPMELTRADKNRCRVVIVVCNLGECS